MKEMMSHLIQLMLTWWIINWIPFYHFLLSLTVCFPPTVVIAGHEVAKDFKSFMTDLQVRLQRTRDNYNATQYEAENLMLKMLEARKTVSSIFEWVQVVVFEFWVILICVLFCFISEIRIFIWSCMLMSRNRKILEPLTKCTRGRDTSSSWKRVCSLTICSYRVLIACILCYFPFEQL